MRDHGSEFGEAGVRVGMVLQASSEETAGICGDAPGFACVPDPEHVTHRALGLGKMSMGAMLTSSGLRARRKEAARAGHGQHWGRTFAKTSDWTMVPGAALVARDGRLLWVHRGEHVGDLPSAAALLEVTRSVLA